MKFSRILSPDILKDPVPDVLLGLSFPIIIGIIANMSYLLADAYFIGQLGANQLAVVGFSQPIQMFVLQLSIGMNIGGSSVISRIVGAGDREKAVDAGKSVIIISFVIALLISFVGISLTKPIFSLIGANEELMPLIEKYMLINFPALSLQFFVMVSSGLFRSRGNMIVPGVIICLSAALNTLLDPILIFGTSYTPSLGLEGAAISSVIAYGGAAIMSISLLLFRYKWLNIKPIKMNRFYSLTKEVSSISVPAAASNSANPIATSFAIYLLSSYGPEVVGAFGMATRIRAFALIPLLALSAGVSPFTGQCYGAGKIVRMKSAWNWCVGSSLVWGVILILTFYLLANSISQLVLEGERLQEVSSLYLFIVSFGFSAYGISIAASSILNASELPLQSSALIFIRMLILYPIFTFIGMYYLEIEGIFYGIALAQVIGGGMSFFYLQRKFSEWSDDSSLSK